MVKTACTVPISQIILDEDIYPRSGVYPKRVSMFAENIRDGFKIDPIEVQIHPEYGDKYRILDGAHRWHAYKEIGATEIPVHTITLDSLDPLLYAAKKAIGPLQLTEDEARTTVRRAYENNLRLTSFEIGQAIGCSRQTVDAYIADLRAATNMEIDIKIFRMHRLGFPQDRIAKRMGVNQKTIHNHLGEMPELAFLLNTDLIDSRRLTGDCGRGTCGTGMIVINVSEMIGLPAIALAQAFAQARRAGPVASRPK